MKKKERLALFETEFITATEKHDGVFGHNIQIPKSDFVSMIDNGAEVEIIDNYACKIKLPSKKSKRDSILLHLCQMKPSNLTYAKTTSTINAEWHY